MYIERRFPWPREVRAAAVAVLLAALAGCCWAAYYFVYVPKVVRPREYEQRKLFEEYEQEILSRVPAAKTPEDITAVTNAEKESRRRFGVHPDKFRDLPPTQSAYYGQIAPPR